MTASTWPLFDLVVRTPRLELRLPRDDELEQLARLGAGGVHAPEEMPFEIPWTDVPSPARERSSLQWWWSQRAAWTPEAWNLTAGVFVDGLVVGVQDLGARDFAALRSVVTGSWLGREHQGRGLGKEMRAAALHLAFDHLGAVQAESGAWHDNLASQRVSQALGYAENGTERRLRRGVPVEKIRYLLTRDTWASRRRDDIEVTGLDVCLELFGIDEAE